MTVLNDLPDEAKSNPRAASVRFGSMTAQKLSGQIKHDLRQGKQPDYVDSDRSALNRVIIEYERPATMKKIAQDRRSVGGFQRAVKSNAAVATAGVISFGSDAASMFETLTQAEQDSAIREVADAMAAHMGTTLHGLTVHLDETTIHAHFVLSGRTLDGKPVSKVATPGHLSDAQTLLATVLQRYCPDIERGRRYGDRIEAGADYADTLHKSVKRLHSEIPQELERAQAAVADAEARADEMRARVAKLQEKAELTEKETKRLATYEKRLADRVSELENAQAEAERLKSATRAEAEAEGVAVRAAMISKAQSDAAQIVASAKAEADRVRMFAEGEKSAAAAALTRAKDETTRARDLIEQARSQKAEAEGLMKSVRGALDELARVMRTIKPTVPPRFRGALQGIAERLGVRLSPPDYPATASGREEYDEAYDRARRDDPTL